MRNETIKVLLEGWMEIDMMYGNRRTVFDMMPRKGNTGVARQLLEGMASISLRYGNGAYMLHVVAKMVNCFWCRLLLATCARRGAEHVFGRTAAALVVHYSMLLEGE